MVEEEQSTEVPQQETNYAAALEKAQQAASRLEEQNLRFEENIKKMEKVALDNMLAGKSETKEPVEEESDKDYAAKALRGEL